LCCHHFFLHFLHLFHHITHVSTFHGKRLLKILFVFLMSSSNIHRRHPPMKGHVSFIAYGRNGRLNSPLCAATSTHPAWQIFSVGRAFTRSPRAQFVRRQRDASDFLC